MRSTPSLYSLIRRSATLLLVPLILALPVAANAAFIDFTGSITGAANGGTVPAPLSVRDPLTGFIQIDDAAAAPGSSFGLTDLLDFDFMIGALDFNPGNARPFGFFSGTVSDDGTTLSQFDATTNFTGPANCPGAGCSLTLNGDNNAFTISTLGFPPDVVEGTLASTVRAANNVPEPSAILAFALGLLLLGWGIRRRSTYR